MKLLRAAHVDANLAEGAQPPAAGDFSSGDEDEAPLAPPAKIAKTKEEQLKAASVAAEAMHAALATASTRGWHQPSMIALIELMSKPEAAKTVGAVTALQTACAADLFMQRHQAVKSGKCGVDPTFKMFKRANVQFAKMVSSLASTGVSDAFADPTPAAWVIKAALASVWQHSDNGAMRAARLVWDVLHATDAKPDDDGGPPHAAQAAGSAGQTSDSPDSTSATSAAGSAGQLADVFKAHASLATLGTVWASVAELELCLTARAHMVIAMLIEASE
eukprot:4372714-Pyramimonas_sp.AAC.1